LRYYIENKV